LANNKGIKNRLSYRLVNQGISQFKAEQESRNAALKALRHGGKILNGTEEQLFSLLQHEGILVEENGTFMIKGKDKYGFPMTQEITKALPDLLRDKYAQYSADNIEISQNTSGKSQSDNVGELSTETLYKMIQNGDSSLDKAFEQARQLYS